MSSDQTPGVYREDIFLEPAAGLRTGVPLFLGYAGERAEPANRVPVNTAKPLTLWLQFEQHFGSALADSYLASAVAGFFRNGGDLCYVVRLDDKLLPIEALGQGLEVAAVLDSIDLVCAPDIMQPRQSRGTTLEPAEVRRMQMALLEHCDTHGDRFAILDSSPGADVATVLEQRQGLSGANAALYYPWVKVADGIDNKNRSVPPCGHVAGVYARSDRRLGVHKAPANEALEGVVDLERPLGNAEQDVLNPQGINCLRAFPGRGIRVWGARTLSRDPAWTYVNVRRLFLTAGRWIDRHMAGVVYEPNEPRLWARISRELTTYFDGLFLQGALKGSTPQEAFYIKCDAEINPPEVREAGTVITEIGLAPAIPAEFVVVRIIHGASGITITGPA